MRGLPIASLTLALCLSLPAAVGAKPAPVQLSKPAPAAVASTADALAGRVNQNGRFPGGDERNPANGPAFLHLAATHPDPAIVAAALRAMSYTWRSEPRPGGKRSVMTPDYVTVVRARLAAEEGIVRAAALRAARLPLNGRTPDAGVLDAVLAMVTKGSVADQLAAMSALGNVQAFARSRTTKGPIKARVIDTLEPLLLSKEPVIIAATLRRLERSGYPGMPKADAIAAHTLRLAKHPEAAVRGESLRLASTLAGKKADDKLIGRIDASLGDSDPYVRATAAEMAVEFKHRPAVHRIMELIDDEAPAIRKVGGFTALDGRPGQERFRVETSGRLDEVALAAVDALTDGIGPKLECRVSGRNRKAARAQAKADAKAWYAANGSKVPGAPKK